jgi:hypothetical protein
LSSESPAGFNQNSSYGAEQLRRAFGSLLQRGSTIGSVVGGVVAVGDMQITAPGSGMSCNIAPGEAWIPGSSSATQSGYYARVSSTTNLAIAASSPSLPRVDTICAVITDSAYSGATNTFTPVVVTGTPTAGATLSDLSGVGSQPASSLILGYVLVPAAATSIVSGDIANVAGLVSGLSTGSNGTSIVSATQATSSSSYTLLGTPDEVTGIYLPTGGLISVWYQATWAESVAGAARAAIFVGTNQLKVASQADEAAVTQAAATNASVASVNNPLWSSASGLVSSTYSTGYSGDATTGQVVGSGVGNQAMETNGSVHPGVGNGAWSGGPCSIFAAAGTYTISVQYKTSSGSVSASNRKLWVQVLPF